MGKVSQRDYRILMGTTSWRHGEWANEVFYPEDLPEDWYLSFYSNEFPVVLVTNDLWQNEADITQLLEEVEEQATEGFKIVFECDWSTADNIESRVEKLESIKEWVGGILIRAKRDDFDLPEFRQQVASLKSRFQICIELNNGNTQGKNEIVKNFCDEHSISVCWNGEGDPIVPNDSTFWISRCDSDQDKKTTIQQLKTVIAEMLKRETQSREHIIFIDGSPPNVEVVRNAMIMIDLM